jgi:hypothetical protein
VTVQALRAKACWSVPPQRPRKIAGSLALASDNQAASSPRERALFSNSGQFPVSELLENLGDPRTSWLVVGAKGIRRGRLGCKPKVVGKYTAKENWKRKKTKKVGCEIDGIT